MGTGYRSAAALIAKAVDGYLYNAHVEFGRTSAVVPTLRPIETATSVQFEAGRNVIVRGRHSAVHESVSGVDGYQAAVTVPALVQSDQTEFHQVIRRGSRLAVRLLDNPPDVARIVYEVRRWEPNDNYRALYHLHALGLERGDVFMLGYGAPWGSAYSTDVASLVDINAEPDD